jgi:hypothetical protein
MNPKKYLEKRIRGWLPKEPHSSGYQRITNHKSLKIGTQIGIGIFMMGFVGGSLGALGYSLGLFSGLDMYVGPILIGIVMATVAAAIVIQTKKNEEQKRMTRESKT